MVIFPLGYKTIWLDDRLHGTVSPQCPAVLSIATASCMFRSIGTDRLHKVIILFPPQS
jgi:hypothetical protein